MWEIKTKSISFKWLGVSLYNKFCYGIFILGSTLTMSFFSINWWDLITFIINANSIEITFGQSNRDNIFELILGLLFIVLSIVFFFSKKKYELWYNAKYQDNLIAIMQQGLQATSFPDFNKKTAGKDFRNFHIHPIIIDEIDFINNEEYIDVLKNQNSIISDIAKLTRTHTNYKLAYWGITRIPLAYSLGVKLSDTQSINIFDYNRTKRKWNQLSYSWLKNKRIKPQRFLIEKSNIHKASSQDVIVCISTTFMISKVDCIQAVPNYHSLYDLKLTNIKNGKRDRLRTIKEMDMLAESYRKLMDEISTKTNIKTVHLFYAGPNSLAFKFGTVLSEAIHPKVLVYNYNRNDTPCFSWAYDSSKDEIISFKERKHS